MKQLDLSTLEDIEVKLMYDESSRTRKTNNNFDVKFRYLLVGQIIPNII